MSQRSNSYKFYEEWKNWGEAKFGTYSKSECRYYEDELSISGIEDLSGLEVFELGFGNGSFAAFMADSGSNYIGADLIPELIERARVKGFQVVQGPVQEADVHRFDSKFDLIVAFDVLEHICKDDLIDFITSARQMLRPGGRLIARVPSGDSPFGRALYHGDLTHQTCLGSSAVIQLAKISKFRVVRISGPALPCRRVGIMRGIRRISVIIAQKSISRLINLIYYGGDQKVMNPNLVFVLEKPHSAPADDDSG